MDEEKLRVYAIAIPDTEEAFLEVTGGDWVHSWDEITTDAVDDQLADAVIDNVVTWWKSL
jgi:hypothetical protein